jgi:hypothetical protein
MSVGPATVVALVLAVAGIGKFRAPSNALAAWDALGLPGRSMGIRVVAALELVVAVGVLCGSEIAAWAMAVIYLAFAGVVALLLRRGHREISCGCFGVPATPLRPMHAVLDVVCAAVAVWTATAGTPTVLDAVRDDALAGSLTLLAALVGTYVLALSLTRLPLATPAVAESVSKRGRTA